MKRRKKNNLIPILFILLAGISLGYALLTQNLTITGVSKVKGNEWNIHFDNVQVSSGSVTLSDGDSAAEIDSNDDTSVNYTVTLNVPGDYYEFTVDAVNEGTIDGMIGSFAYKLNNVIIDDEHPAPIYLYYSITYADGAPVNGNQLLEAGNTETFKVRIEFLRDIENDELPSTLQSNTFSFELNYIQKTDEAEEVQHPVTGTRYAFNINYESLMRRLSYETKLYRTFSDVQTALRKQYDHTIPIALKYVLDESIITEWYIEFVITSEDVTANPEMTAGTYLLKGSIAEEEGDHYYIHLPDEYYDYNKSILTTAFGSINCTETINTRKNYYCSASEWSGATSNGGRSLSSIQLGNDRCRISNEGDAICESY